MIDLYDYHNGPNLGLEPTPPMKAGEYLTLVFEKPISPAVHAIFAAQEWVAASHYDALRERDNYAREVAELRAEIERKDAEVARMRRQLEWTEAYARDTLATNSRDMDDWRGDVEHIANSARALLARYGNAAAQKADDARDAAIDAAQAQPKRRPYNASGSLGEYGVSPECDAAPVAAQAPTANADAWKAAVDHELTALHSTADSFASPREAVRALIDWHISVERDRVADLEADLEERVAEQKTAKEYARAAAQAEAAAGDARDREDAERYRLLRRKVRLAGGEFHILNLDPRYIAQDSAAELDAAIDAAMREEGSND